MSNDYNDVDKLLTHIHLDNFAYRSFRKNDGAAIAAEPVAAEAVVPMPAAAAAATPPPVLRVVRPAEPPVASVAPPAPVPAAVSIPASSPGVAVSAPGVTVAPAPQAAEVSPLIGDTLARLMRGSITDSAPKLHLNLHLPPRPAPSAVEVAAPEGERKLSDVFGKLHTAAAVKPRVVSGTER